jgi:hypothetical protein
LPKDKEIQKKRALTGNCCQKGSEKGIQKKRALTGNCCQKDLKKESKEKSINRKLLPIRRDPHSTPLDLILQQRGSASLNLSIDLNSVSTVG